MVMHVQRPPGRRYSKRHYMDTANIFRKLYEGADKFHPDYRRALSDALCEFATLYREDSQEFDILRFVKESQGIP